MIHFEIVLKVHLDSEWRQWFEEYEIADQTDGSSALCGEVADQSALYGLLAKIRELGLVLLSVDIKQSGRERPLQD